MSFQHLQKLLDAVPEKRLQLGVVAGGKPGILAGQLPVFRVRDDAIGANYSDLIVEVVNALPDLLLRQTSLPSPNALETLPASYAVDPALRESMIAEITHVLNMRLGARKGSMAIWGKLIWMNIESRLQSSTQGLSTLRVPKSLHRVQDDEDAHNARLEAVLDFCCFVQANGSPDDVPESSVLDAMASSWNRERNGLKI